MPDNFDYKTAKAIDEMYKVSKKTGEKTLITTEYENPKSHKFRDEVEIEPGMTDFMLRVRPPPIDNPHNLSVFAARPKFITDKEKQKEEEKLAEDKFAAAGKPHDWLKYHDLNHRYIPVSKQFDDKHNKVAGKTKEATEFLSQDQWTPAYLTLARTMKDDFVYGKPKLDLYFRGLKTEQTDVEFGGTTKPLRVLQ